MCVKLIYETFLWTGKAVNKNNRVFTKSKQNVTSLLYM